MYCLKSFDLFYVILRSIKFINKLNITFRSLDGLGSSWSYLVDPLLVLGDSESTPLKGLFDGELRSIQVSHCPLQVCVGCSKSLKENSIQQV